ncbi:MAG: HEPN domain-containing protein [Planctomycetes bacterium]|nr:HEPN domain-containing protein [Planctomycetota bacterium]
MTEEQRDLLCKARESLEAARLLRDSGHVGFAASRAYYSMLYVAEAFLLGKELAFSKHSAVHAAFARHFCKTGAVPPKFHRYLEVGMVTRHAGDYGKGRRVTPEEAAEQIAHAEEFLELGVRLIGPLATQGGRHE